MVVPPTPSKLLIVYLPGASPLFAGNLAATNWAKKAPTLTAVVRDGVSGTLRLSDPPRDANNANHELAHLLGLDVTPRRDFATAFQKIHPNLDLTVITPSPDAHLLATDVSLSTTLLCASSLTASGLASMTHRALDHHQAVLVHLPYFAPHTLAARGSYWTTPHRVSSDLEPIVGPRRPPEIEPAPKVITNADQYVALVDEYLSTILPDAGADGWLVSLVMSWDQVHLSDTQIESAMSTYANLSTDLGTRKTENSTIDARQVKHFRDSTMRSLPLTVVYAQSDLSEGDSVDQLDVFKMYVDGGRGSMGAWSFLKSITAKTDVTSQCG